MADKLRGGSTVGGNIIWHAGNSNSALANWTANNIIATSVSATTFNGALSGNASTATSSVSVTGTQAAAITANTAKVSNVSTNLSYTTAATTGTVVSSDGTNAVIPAATTTVAGLMTGTDKTKLNGIASGATANAGTVTSVSGSGSLTGTVTTSGSISHLATDGHLHVPVTSTTNSGKVLTAGATAGSLSWQTPTVGTVTSVVAGNGMTQSGTSTINPTLNVVSHAGTAGTIGTINVSADAIGVNLGTTSTTAARGDHSHSYLPLTGGTLSGALTATSFSGVGTALTALNATNLTTGTLPDARLTGTYTGLTNLTGTGTVDFSLFYGNAADSVTAPSFSWTGDTNTGIYSPGADQLAITTGGVQRALFSSAGITGTLVGNASSCTLAADSSKLNGVASAEAATASTIVKRNSSGYIYGAAFNSTLADTATAATHYYVENSSDGWLRPKTLANVQAEIVTAAAITATGFTSGATNGIFYENGQTVTSSYTIAAGKNAMSAGPITINTGVTVTISTGARWVIL